MQIIGVDELKTLLDWEGVLDAIATAHRGRRPVGESFFLSEGGFGLFSRGVIFPGLGAGVKVASIDPSRTRAVPPLPAEHALFLLIEEETKSIAAVLDGPEITRWKTAADSALAARTLSRDDSSVLLVLGGGPIASALAEAYLHVRPSLSTVLLWNRTPDKLEAMAHQLRGNHRVEVRVVSNLNEAVGRADIIASATGATSPLIHGQFVRPGTHVDLIGGFRKDMREADDEVVRNATIFVDHRENAAECGDISEPLRRGTISAQDIRGDLFDLCKKGYQREEGERTVYKNAGGAHLDLVVSQYAVSKSQRTRGKGLVPG